MPRTGTGQAGRAQQWPRVRPHARLKPSHPIRLSRLPSTQPLLPCPLFAKGEPPALGRCKRQSLGCPKCSQQQLGDAPLSLPTLSKFTSFPFPISGPPPQLPAPFLLDLLTASNCRPGPRTSLDAPAASAHIFTGQGDTTSLRPRFGTAPLAPLHASPPSPQLFLHEPVAAIKYSWPCVVNKHYKFMTC